MANELSIEIKLTYTPTDANQIAVTTPRLVQSIAMTGTDHFQGTWAVGTSEEILLGADVSGLTGVGTIGWVMLTNLDATNFVEFASDTTPTNYPIRLNAGETCVFRMGQVNGLLRGKADTAEVDVQYLMFEA